jgi:hypothetical protein
MSKNLNLVYEWIGPRGPISNNKLPTLADFIVATINPDNKIEGVHYTHPHLYERFPSANLFSTARLPTGKFIYEFNFTTKHYYDVTGIFTDAHGFLSDRQVKQEVIERVRSKTAYFMITVLFESYLSDKFLMAMTHYFNNNGIPLSQIIYLSNCANGKEIYEDFCKRNNLTPEINLEYFPTFRVDKTDLRLTLEKYKNIPYEPGPREKLFLNFNRRYSDHRLVFYTYMFKKNLLDKFFMSMSATQPERERSFFENMKYLVSRYPNLGFTEQDAADAEKPLPLILDNNNFNSYPMENTVDAVEYYYRNSLINIVSETFFFDKPIHITEKTFKPVAFKQPFVMVGSYGSLKHVKDLGFKTFSQFWNEDYDLIQDSEQRMLAVLNIVEEISKWNDECKIKFSYEVKDIIEYNFNHLYTMRDTELDNFVEIYGE